MELIVWIYLIHINEFAVGSDVYCPPDMDSKDVSVAMKSRETANKNLPKETDTQKRYQGAKQIFASVIV